jgi:hypothetical protein
VLKLKGYPQLKGDEREKVRAFFRRSCWIFADVDRFVAERAQELVWKYELRPKDATHVATAVVHSIPVLDTFDRPLITRSGKIPLADGKGNLLITEPSLQGRDRDFPQIHDAEPPQGG